MVSFELIRDPEGNCDSTRESSDVFMKYTCTFVQFLDNERKDTHKRLYNVVDYSLKQLNINMN